ncbi:MAG TPA: hypothetical protein VM221_12640 [Armatimonadota bacterium]|nr:hypothetical protein [Armatimonadota bacterium]
MRALVARIGRRWERRESASAHPDDALSSGFWVPLPAATFAWWVLVVRPVWMPEPEVRQALVVAFLVVTPLCLIGFWYRLTRIGVAVNLLALASLLLCAASLYAYSSAAEVPLAALGTVAGAAALTLAARALWCALRPVRDRGMATYFLIVLLAVLVVVVGESALWSWRQYDLWRLVAVSACAAAMLYGIRWWPKGRPVLVRFLTVATTGLVLALVAEALQFAAGVQRSQAAGLLQHFGGQFLAYFGGGMSLTMLPTELRREQESANPESQQ